MKAISDVKLNYAIQKILKLFNSHAKRHASDGGDPITPASIGAIPAAQKGVADGVASLDADGKVPAAQLPSVEVPEHKHNASDINAGTLPVTRGGTGSANGATGLKNLLAAGNTVLSSYQYGTELPPAGASGRIFFKKV